MSYIKKKKEKNKIIKERESREEIETDMLVWEVALIGNNSDVL